MRFASHTEHLHADSPDVACARGQHHSHVQVQLTRTVIGIAFILNAYLIEWLFEHGSAIAAGSALIGALILGCLIVWTAMKDLRLDSLNTNVLVALAVIALLASAHYQEAGIVSFFMQLGQIIETRTAEGALASIHSLIKLTPTRARRVHDQSEEEVAVHELGVGDIIRLRPGDNVAADGVIVSGHGSFNQATITGESLPVDKAVGDEVFAGTVNLTGVLEIRVTRAGQDTTLGRVRDLILAAEKTKLPILHKPFGALAISTLMVAGRAARKTQVLVNVGFALVTPLGALLFFLGAGHLAHSHPVWLGAALAFCAGTFLCIACMGLLPELQFHTHDRVKLSLALLARIGVAVLIARYGHAGHDQHSGAPSFGP